MPRLVCFDCETDPFVPEFNKAAGSDRLHLAPSLRLCCTFDGTDWNDFWPDQKHELIAYLQDADALLSFNGIQFDELVLRKHAGLKGNLPRSGKHHDLCHQLHERNTPASLNELALLNLGEPKLIKGSSMPELTGADLVTACRSDVLQTWRLWQLWKSDQLQLPKRTRPDDDPFDVGPGHHAPILRVCPKCGDQ